MSWYQTCICFYCCWRYSQGKYARTSHLKNSKNKILAAYCYLLLKSWLLFTQVTKFWKLHYLILKCINVWTTDVLLNNRNISFTSNFTIKWGSLFYLTQRQTLLQRLISVGFSKHFRKNQNIILKNEV